jgi:hypothetical protein
MLNSQNTDRSRVTDRANPGLETIEKWLRALPRAELEALKAALASNHAEGLAGFRIRFHAWLERSGSS